MKNWKFIFRSAQSDWPNTKRCNREIIKLKTHPKILLSVSHHRSETDINDRPNFIIDGMHLDPDHYFSHCRRQLSTAPDVTHFYCPHARHKQQIPICLKLIFRSYSYFAVAYFPLGRDRSYVNYPGNLFHNDENWRIAAGSTLINSTIVRKAKAAITAPKALKSIIPRRTARCVNVTRGCDTPDQRRLTQTRISG